MIDCKVEDFGRIVKIRSVVKIRFAWTSIFNDPAKNYSELPGIQTVRKQKSISACFTVESTGIINFQLYLSFFQLEDSFYSKELLNNLAGAKLGSALALLRLS